MTQFTYEIITSELGAEIIKRTDKNDLVAWIPKDPANSDYQRYLNSEAEQSTPIVTDEAKTK
jgi:hypothetical protein